MAHYDVIVVGLGAMGAAACDVMARRGMNVLGVDRYDVPNTMGTSHGDSRVIRMCYYEHPDYVPLLRIAYDEWRRLDESVGGGLLHLVGGLFIGPASDPLIAGSIVAADAHELPYETLSQGQLSQRYPQFRVPATYVGLVEPNAGFLRPEASIEALIERAKAHGATVRTGARVLDWSQHGSGYEVRLADGKVQSGQVAFCAGPWTASLVPSLRAHLTVTRQPMAWFEPVDRARLELGRLPVWALADGRGDFHYGFPLGPNESAMKTAWHHVNEAVDPEAIDRRVSRAETDALHEVLRRHLPAAAGPLQRAAMCMYTCSPDGHFIIDHLPGAPGVVVATGMSGHGFKCAPVVGRVLADLLQHGSTDLPAGFLGLSRLARG